MLGIVEGGGDPRGRGSRGQRRSVERSALGSDSAARAAASTAEHTHPLCLTSEPGLGIPESARSPGAWGAQRGARRSLVRERAPGTHRAPSARRPAVQCGCRCPNGGHGLARPGAGKDGVEAAAATETAAARLGPGREPRGRGARAGPREHVGPERSAGCAAAGAAALLGPEAEPSR